MPLPIPLTSHRVFPTQQEFRDILAWPFPTERFYEAQVTRLLEFDIPRRVETSFGIVRLYRDPDGNAVGFSTLDVCRDYGHFTDGNNHSYIPLLAVHPQF